MKKLWIAVFCWSLAVSLKAQTQAVPAAPATLAPNQRWVEQIDGSFSIPTFSSQHEPDPGTGGDINVGYRFDRTFALFLGTGYYQYGIPAATSQFNAHLAYIPLTLIFRVTFGDGEFRPYLFEGAGLALNIYTQNDDLNGAVPTSQSEIDFYMTPGLGISYAFASDMAVFVQSRIDLDFTSHNGLGLPLGNPSVFIPLQAGISFFAL